MPATIKPFTDEFEEYGRDESRSSGEASSISFRHRKTRCALSCGSSMSTVFR